MAMSGSAGAPANPRTSTPEWARAGGWHRRARFPTQMFELFPP